MSTARTKRGESSACTSVSLNVRLKRKLDALARVGRRSRTATIEVLMESYLASYPSVRSLVETEMENRRA
jgi:predicted transcriptional regulator